MVIKYEVMSQNLDGTGWEFEKMFDSYEEAEIWINKKDQFLYKDISFTIFKVYKGK